MHQRPAQRPASGRHRPRFGDPAPLRPADVDALYRSEHPGRLRAIGRRETRVERAKFARRVAARHRFLADANRRGRPLVVTA